MMLSTAKCMRVVQILHVFLNRAGYLIGHYIACVSVLPLSGCDFCSEALQQRAHLPLHVPGWFPLQTQGCAGGSEGLGGGGSGHAGVSSHCRGQGRYECNQFLSVHWQVEPQYC